MRIKIPSLRHWSAAWPWLCLAAGLLLCPPQAQARGFAAGSGFSPSGHGIASSGSGTSSPGLRRSNPGRGYSPPSVGRPSPGRGYSPPSRGALPPGAGFSPPSRGRRSVPPGRGYSPPSLGRYRPAAPRNWDDRFYHLPPPYNPPPAYYPPYYRRYYPWPWWGWIGFWPPLGAIVLELPWGYYPYVAGGVTYYYYAGVCYRRVPRGYLVVEPPAELVAVRPSQPLAGTVRATAPALNVRYGPGAEYDVVAVVSAGTELAVLGAAPGWLYVRLPSGNLGWVAERFTLPANIAASG